MYYVLQYDFQYFPYKCQQYYRPKLRKANLHRHLMELTSNNDQRGLFAAFQFPFAFLIIRHILWNLFFFLFLYFDASEDKINFCYLLKVALKKLLKSLFSQVLSALGILAVIVLIVLAAVTYGRVYSLVVGQVIASIVLPFCGLTLGYGKCEYGGFNSTALTS